MIRTRTKKVMCSAGRAAFLAIAFWIFTADNAALAQGCATCYTTAAAGGSQTIHALRSGILVLLFPPVLIFCGIVTLLWRWSAKPVATENT